MEKETTNTQNQCPFPEPRDFGLASGAAIEKIHRRRCREAAIAAGKRLAGMDAWIIGGHHVPCVNPDLGF